MPAPMAPRPMSPALFISVLGGFAQRARHVGALPGRFNAAERWRRARARHRPEELQGRAGTLRRSRRCPRGSAGPRAGRRTLSGTAPSRRRRWVAAPASAGR
jgi:hypothetical protein